MQAYYRKLFYSHCYPTINIVLCPAVLQRPDIGESRRYECGAHQNQPDPYGEVPQASGCVPDTGGLQSDIIEQH